MDLLVDADKMCVVLLHRDTPCRTVLQIRTADQLWTILLTFEETELDSQK